MAHRNIISFDGEFYLLLGSTEGLPVPPISLQSIREQYRTNVLLNLQLWILGGLPTDVLP